MRVRPFEERDRPSLERLMDAFGDELAAMDPYGRVIRAPGMGAHAVRRMLRRSRESDGIVLVATERGRVVGFASGEIYRRERDERFEVVNYTNGEVSELYVSPRYRRRGAGRALLGALDEHFREGGCGAVHVDVFAPNRDARSFYESLGYEERELLLFRRLEG